MLSTLLSRIFAGVMGRWEDRVEEGEEGERGEKNMPNCSTHPTVVKGDNCVFDIRKLLVTLLRCERSRGVGGVSDE